LAHPPNGAGAILVEHLVINKAPLALARLLLAGDAHDIRVIQDIDVGRIAPRFLADVEAARLDLVETALRLLGG
jgi:hypothetical protein